MVLHIQYFLQMTHLLLLGPVNVELWMVDALPDNVDERVQSLVQYVDEKWIQSRL